MDTIQEITQRSGHRPPMQDAEFERLVHATRDRALAVARAYLDDWDEARDAVQEAYLRAYRKRGTFRGEASPDTWLLRILANHCRDRLRRRKVRRWLRLETAAEAEEAILEQVPSDTPDPAAASENTAFRHALAAALGDLPARQREVFRLKALGGLTLTEVAAALGISVGATKSHFFRATRALQRSLAPWREES
ncbi:MAG TPA: RNA polymerase sigma factor [Deferrisomatales bacterium]|nr:RNA polymerase sigma factor [Deferrisomatales bacterium]